MTSVMSKYMKQMMEEYEQEYEQDEMVTQVATDKVKKNGYVTQVVDLLSEPESESESEPESEPNTKKRKLDSVDDWEIPPVLPADPVAAVIRLNALVRNSTKYTEDLWDGSFECAVEEIEEWDTERKAVIKCIKRDCMQMQVCFNSNDLPQLVHNIWGNSIPNHIAEMACEITESNHYHKIHYITPLEKVNQIRLIYVEFALSCKVKQQENQLAVCFKSGNVNAFSIH